jgi:hypothetical protein
MKYSLPPLSKICLSFVVFLFVFTSCSKDDSEDNIEGTSKRIDQLFAYQGELFYDISFSYNDSGKIVKIITEKYQAATFYREINVSYNDDRVNKITDLIDWPNSSDDYYEFDVFYDDGLIRMISPERTFKIYHEDGYVNEIRELFTTTANIITKAEFFRDSEQNLSHVIYNDNLTDFYSGFDSNKTVLINSPVLNIIGKDYINVLGLKVTENNPSSKTQIIHGSENPVTSGYSLEYDNEGHITKVSHAAPSRYMDVNYLE